MALAAHISLVAVALWIIVGLLALAVLAALIGRVLVRLGLRQPFAVRVINRTSDRVVDAVKRPITIAVLGEVAEVLEAGHYTRNIAAALRENSDQLKQMVAEKLRDDPTTSRFYLLPFHDRVIEEASETTLRVVFEILADPRTDELVSDLLRENVRQIRQAVQERMD